MQGHWTEARDLLLETASLAKSRGEREIEFFAEITLIAAHTALGQIDQARGFGCVIGMLKPKRREHGQILTGLIADERVLFR
jgi:hypothetical protein